MGIHRIWPAIVPLVLGLAACKEQPVDSPVETATPTPRPSASIAPAPGTTPGPEWPAGAWETVASGEGDGMFFGASEGEATMMHLFCPAEGGLLVNVSSFMPIGSEERMSLGYAENVVALVADQAGDGLRGGVSGEGQVPSALSAILTAEDGVAVSYGAQDLGPLPPVPEDIARRFVTGCRD